MMTNPDKRVIESANSFETDIGGFLSDITPAAEEKNSAQSRSNASSSIGGRPAPNSNGPSRSGGYGVSSGAGKG